MKPAYLKLTNGKEVRVEWNMNSLGAFTKDTGIEMTDLAKGKADMFILRKVAWYMAKEGEEIDGRSFDMTEVELGRNLDQEGVIVFARIFADQAKTSGQKKNLPQKSPMIFFRKRG
jgi:hypothetical protein